MTGEDKKAIAEIMVGMQCPKNFHCAETEFGQLCRAKDIGLESYVERQEESLSMCPFAI
ncbi:MAG: hypothetical protein K9M45_00620 [Kiritimatiellales bacterium]|nr:hypothetical protein [Kiritimatiellales bacterium]